MKILILSNHIAALPTINALFEKKWLECVVTSGNQLIKNEIHDFCDLKGIACYEVITQTSFSEQVHDLIISTKADLVLVFGFSKKIPNSLLDLPPLGFFNVHFSLLPAYRGPAPLFWQIKNGETFTGITIHKISSSLDSGPILHQQQVQLRAEESFGALNHRLSLIAVSIIAEAFDMLNNNDYMLTDQNEHLSFTLPSVNQQDLIIDWENQTAAEIMNLVNACNPVYNGAIAFLNGQEVSIVEVSPAIINDVSGEEPGTIVFADGNYGLFVACKYDSFLRINVVRNNESILSGHKLVALGVKTGARFSNNIQDQILNN
ncbi:methionyl-tRNA formyltransferase [Pedobacter miscanthi]|uniref:Uncharacterized protein n=1 Tax=Pedobacter miscanthi TaxID=2259170 RepID=A0A366KYI4_9SPHI|nr:methionyl-tRNA formyltransferase [Pedobacter miscanthi]RBQ06638.1 hypothetical protein DRW42_12675 [Pedobacter miscanthi]